MTRIKRGSPVLPWSSEFDELVEYNSLREIPKSAFKAQYLKRMERIQGEYLEMLMQEAERKGWEIIEAGGIKCLR